MKTNREEKPFDYDEYSCSTDDWKIVTKKDELPVEIVYYPTYQSEDGNYYFVASIIQNDTETVLQYNVKDGKPFGREDSDFDLILVKYTSEIESITEKDVPDTPEFEDEYNHFLKYSFKMDKVEYMRYRRFGELHRECRAGKTGAIGGGLAVSFMGTGLGNCVQCNCEICGATEDITNFDNW